MKNLTSILLTLLALLVLPLPAKAFISTPCNLTIYEDISSFPTNLDSNSLTVVDLGEGGTVTIPNGTEAVFIAGEGLPSELPTLILEVSGISCSVDPPSTNSSLFGILDARGLTRISLSGAGPLPYKVYYGHVFPVANAGDDRMVPVGSSVQLDARSSYDPDTGYPLQYRWNLTDRPTGSEALLSDPVAATPSFMPEELGDYVFELIVTDVYGLDSLPVTVTITATNSAPVAEAGDDKTVAVGSAVTLNGCLSSDAEPGILTYLWNIADAPVESGMVLSGTDTCAPTFVADVPGSYLFELVVTDSFGIESTDSVTITASGNTQPTAEAGVAQTVHVGTLAFLNGSASSDPDGDPITYAWSLLTGPPNSKAALSGANTVTPTLRPDRPGSYEVQLVVTDSGGLQSLPDVVTIDTSNSAPKADAGPDQAIMTVGTLVALDGSKSSDPDDDDLTYEWVLISRPPTSKAELSDPNSDPARPALVADAHGDYTVRLVVRDTWAASDPDLVKVSFSNVKPVAVIVSSTSGVVDDPVTLDGTTSSDANGDALTYLWSLISSPSGSTASIGDPAAEVATFTPDRPGAYIAQLIVNDGFESSNPTTFTIQVVSERTAVITAIHGLQTQIDLLTPRAFRQPIMKRLLNLELNLVLAAVERGRYRAAIVLLANGILNAADGCAIRGTPDRNDWIVDCAAQRAVYAELQEMITMLREML